VSSYKLHDNNTKEIFEKNKFRLKRLLDSINLESLLGRNLKPLIRGYISEIYEGEVLGRPIIFVYKNESGEIKIIDYTPIYNEHTCEVCAVFGSKYDGITCCESSISRAFERLFGCADISDIDCVFERIDDDPSHIGYRYKCGVLDLTEWIIPLFINNVCIGSFITGRFYIGDNDNYANDIHSALTNNYPDKAKLFTVEKIKECKAPLNEPDESHKATLLKKIIEIQESLQTTYDNELARCEKQILSHLMSMVAGEFSDYSESLGKIQNRFLLAQVLLFESLIVLQDIFSLKETVVLTNDIDLRGDSSRISGALLMGECIHKAEGETYLYNRVFHEPFQVLNVEKFKKRYYEKSRTHSDSGLFAKLVIRDGNSQEFFLTNEGMNALCGSEKFICSNSERSCSYTYRAFEGEKPICPDYNSASGCPHFMTHAEVPDASLFSNCLLFVYASKNNMDCPTAFFLRFNDSTTRSSEKRIESFLEHLSTVFLAQWSTLLAEKNREDAESNITYIRHEVRETISAQNGILHKIETRYNKTIQPGGKDLRISYPELPTALLDLLEYIGDIFFDDYGVTIHNLSDIVDNYNILTEELKLNIVPNYPMNKFLNAIPPVFKNSEEFGSRWLERKQGWQDGKPTHADIDPGKLGQALRNLVRNAQKYGYAKTNIILDYGLDQKKSDHLFFTVSSFGLAIPPDEQERIFDKGYRGKKYDDEHEPGRGLGLFVARRIAELHNGELILASSSVESELNVVLLKAYIEVYEKTNIEWLNSNGYSEITYNKCIKEIDRLGEKTIEEILCLPDRMIESKNAVKKMEPKRRRLASDISMPTFRNTFLLRLPVGGKKNDIVR